MTRETFTDSSGRVWYRHESGIDWGRRQAGTWIEMRGGSMGRVGLDGVWHTGESFEKWPGARSAWSALIGYPPVASPRPATFTDRDGDVWHRVDRATIGLGSRRFQAGDEVRELGDELRIWPEQSHHGECARAAWSALIGSPPVDRPESWTDELGCAWRRHEGGIDWGLTEPGTWIEVRGTVAGRTDVDGSWTPVRYAGIAERAWSILIGDPLPAQTLSSMGADVSPGDRAIAWAERCNVLAGRALVPEHHWSFRCAPGRLDVDRVYREMAALGVPRDQVSVTIHARGKGSIRVAVHS